MEGTVTRVPLKGFTICWLINPMYTELHSPSRKQTSIQIQKDRVRVGYCTDNTQLGFVATVRVGRDPSGGAITLRWQDLDGVLVR